MRIKIILFLIILLQFNSLRAEKFQSLNPNIDIYDDDVDAMQNLIYRCSGLYAHLGFLIKDQEPKIGLSFSLLADAMIKTFYVADMMMNETSSLLSLMTTETPTLSESANVNNLIEEKIEMYNEDMDSNYVNTGSHYSQITRDDLATCTEYFARQFDIEKEGMYDNPDIYLEGRDMEMPLSSPISKRLKIKLTKDLK